jgi:hypothetical protein
MQGIFPVEGPSLIPKSDPGIAIGPGPASGTYTLYALLVPTSGTGSHAVGSFLYHSSKRSFHYQTRYTTATPPGQHTVSSRTVEAARAEARLCRGHTDEVPPSEAASPCSAEVRLSLVGHLPDLVHAACEQWTSLLRSVHMPCEAAGTRPLRAEPPCAFMPHAGAAAARCVLSEGTIVR